ncbi:HNH endonuclease [Streptomyces sp. NPDC012888]|uniref:HNH endonuclease n=1 Tax=Streptomyces sp. NPDC012888 TaxID=3364855 RepID=UPI00367784D6
MILTDFDDEPPFRPSGTQHVVCGAIPSGFGAPVYVLGAARQPDRYLRELLERYPALPAGLRTAGSLRRAGLRPLDLFRPDGYVLGPPKTVTMPHRGSRRATSTWTELVYRPSPVYDVERARPLPLSEPDPVREEADRRTAAEWAEQVLADPSTLVLAVNAIGSPAPSTDPLARATPYEVAVTSATGRKRWHRLVDPGWDVEFLRRLDLHGATVEDLREAPPFRDVADELARLLAGRRVVTYGRNTTYAALYTGYEYATYGDGLPEGALWLDVATILGVLGRSRWECARLRHAEFEGAWDTSGGHYALPPAPPAGTALQQCKATAALLRRMAVPALRYAELNARAERTVREGRHHLPRTLTGTRLSRIGASRQAVLERSGGACENPECRDPRFGGTRGRNGSYLLEVDHVDDHAGGGEDLPRSMIALCPNCHALKTRGRPDERLRELLRVTARTRHDRLLAGAPAR